MEEFSDTIYFDSQSVEDMTVLYQKLTDSQKSSFLQYRQLVNTHCKDATWDPWLIYDKTIERLTTNHKRLYTESDGDKHVKKFMTVFAKNGTFITEDDPAISFQQGPQNSP